MEEFSNHCRFCACNGIFELDIFQLDKESNSSIAEELFKLCNIKLDNNEDLPTKICTNCKISLTNLKDFLTNLNKTQQMLQEFQNYFNRIKKKYELNSTKNLEDGKIEFSIIKYFEGTNEENSDSSHESESEHDGIKYSFYNDCKYKISDFLENKKKSQNNESGKQINNSIFNQHPKINIVTMKNQSNTLKRNKNNKKINTIIECDLCGQKCSNQRGLSVHKKKKHVNEDSKSLSINKVKQNVENEENISQNSSNEDFPKDEIYCEITKNHKENNPNTFDESLKEINDIPSLTEPAKTNISENPETYQIFYKNENKSTVKIYKCNLCDRKCTSKGGLTFHIKKTHSKNEDSNFASSQKTKEYLCPHCDRKFTSLNGRWSHIYTVHDKSMRVICDECGKEFPTKYHLLKHKVIHKDVKDLQCPHCPAKFKRQSGLYVHIAIHGESFSCEICGLVLNTQKLLKDHMIVHSDVKKYKCNFCDKNFKRSRNLYSHIETHVGIRAFQCCACDMNFVHYMTYRKHLKRTHPHKFAEMLTKGERISTSNALSCEQLRAINEAAKNGENYIDLLKGDKSLGNIIT